MAPTSSNPGPEAAQDYAPDDYGIDEFAPRDSRRPRLPPTLRRHRRRRTAIVARWLHIYLSMVSFAIILFFAVTGLTLNHADTFSGKEIVTRTTGQLPHPWLRPASGEPDKLSIVESLRTNQKVHGAVTDFRTDSHEIDLSFKAPGYTADAFIDRDTNNFELTETRAGLIAVLNDLHRGTSTGPAWSRVIDASAILLTLVSLTGLILILFLYKRRTSGLLLAAAGAAVCYLLYKTQVP
jgi:hypothetical protein